MPPILDRKLRFSDAVYAIETTPKSLRKWLQNDAVLLFNNAERAGGWHEFSLADIGVFAVMRKAVDYGLGVVEANRLALDVMTQFPDVLNYKNAPPGALATMWVNTTLLVWRDGNTWSREIRPSYDPPVGPPSDAFLTINMEAVLRRAFDRAVESNTDGSDDEGAGE